MLDIKFIRQNQKLIEKASRDKNIPLDLKRLLRVDQKRTKLIKEVDTLRQEKNEITQKIAQIKNSSKKLELIKKMRLQKSELRKKERALSSVEQEFKNLLPSIPNIPAPDVPLGKDESQNIEIKKWGKLPKFNFKIKTHLELGERLDLIDIEKAAKVSGTRFGYLKNDAVLLEFALIQYGLSFLLKKGLIPVIPPVLTKVSVFHKLGYSQHGGNEEYYLVYDPKKENPEEEANYYLVGTAEHSLVPMHKDEIFGPDQLPKRYVGFSTAFRREAGSYGKDTRGIFRVHQFDKLEMISFIKPQPEVDKQEHEYLLSLEEQIIQGLKIPYRIVKMCTGDLGHPAARKYDIECWFPSENRYRETHSVSACTDYQSRALNIKYKDKKGKTEFVHILNGTAFAVGRTILAILENYQQKDSSVLVPKILQPYVGKTKISPRKKIK
jgi:seryl-tRNA synthetase